jgi:penicillin-binding protein 1A
MRVAKTLLRLILFVGIGALFAGGGIIAYLVHKYGRDLPDYQQLASHEPAMVTRVHAGDGRILAEYAIEKRVFVPIGSIPKRVVNAFLAAEDKHFYSHRGIDPLGILRAILTNIENIGSDRRPVGASTITQQVAKNFLLTNEVSVERKVKEALLSLRLEAALSKSRILELYLNEIYLGLGSYGVAAAALNYFNKALDELTVAEAAYLAALPKAPNNYHPVRRYDAAVGRRDWVIGRMVEDGHIGPEEAAEAAAETLEVRRREETEYFHADYFAEEVRRLLFQRYGEDALYRGGLSVRTTLDPRLQRIADAALRQGLTDYDRRHGWRGPIAKMDVQGAWARRLGEIALPPGTEPWRLAVVLGFEADGAVIGFADANKGVIPLEGLTWARTALEEGRLGPQVREAKDVLAVGHIVAVEDLEGPSPARRTPNYALRQIPVVEGAVVALDPHTGRVLALSGGFSYQRSAFNRATQAQRQPGSAFKPFVYLAALERGWTPASIVLDGPIVIDQGPGLPLWKPSNYTPEFYGPSTLRLGIEKSRNLMTVRLAQSVGMNAVGEISERFNVVERLPRLLSMALGAGETNLLRLTAAYGMLVNGGKRITPTMIDRVQDRYGRTVYRHDTRTCDSCAGVEGELDDDPPALADPRQQIVNPAYAYQMVSMLQGVVERGTAVRLRDVGKPLAGKTGTTNDSNDNWFVGFTPDLAVGVFVGHDAPRSLGARETGASTAVPIFRQFMMAALSGAPAIPFRVPPGTRLVRINAQTGKLADPTDRGAILEAFLPGTEPSEAGETSASPGVESSRPTPKGQDSGLY